MIITLERFSLVLQRKKIKRINLRINPTGEVSLSAPENMPLSMIYHFVNSKQAWIEKHRERLLQKTTPENDFLEYIDLKGSRYTIQWQTTLDNPRIEFHNDALSFFVKPDMSAKHKQIIVHQWYKKHMLQTLKPLLEKWQAHMKVDIHKLTLRTMKSRWGSCQPAKKYITLNLRLIEKPIACLEYVLVHELVHLFEASHNKRFYALMESYLPDWKRSKQLLNGPRVSPACES